jgi:hypothetical protein
MADPSAMITDLGAVVLNWAKVSPYIAAKLQSTEAFKTSLTIHLG